MLHRGRAMCILLAAAAAAAAAPGETGAASAPPAVRRPITADLFFEPGCRECERVRENLLPAAALAFGERGLYGDRAYGILLNNRKSSFRT